MKITQADSRNVIHSAVNEYLNFIKPTYGPAGKKVLVMNSDYDVQAIDDGQKGSEAFELENELQNAVVSYMKETAKQMNFELGDGRATSVLLAGAIVNEILKDCGNAWFDKDYYHKVLDIQKAIPEAIEQIKSKSKEIKNVKDLYKITYNSFKNEELAQLIADTRFKVGKDGVIAVDDSPTGEHFVEMVEGLELDKGVISKEMFNVDNKEEAIFKDSPKVLLINKRIDSFNEIFPIIKQATDNHLELCIVAESYGTGVIDGVLFGKYRMGLKAMCIETPGYGDDKGEYLKDISAITGATVFDNKLKLSDFNDTHLGTAKKIISTPHKTTITGGNTDNLSKRVKELEQKLDIKNMYEKDKLIRRIASLKGGIALLKIGAYTDKEQQAIKAKASDAVNASKIAYKDGSVPGGGRTYAGIKTASVDLNKALKYPLQVLEENGKRYLDDNSIDPAGVLIGALKIASSIGCGLLTIGPISSKKREEDKNGRI